jgi:hypothetical protein
MSTIRKEVQMYASACERLLSFEADPELTQDEQDLIVYYAHEIVNEFDVASSALYLALLLHDRQMQTGVILE